MEIADIKQGNGFKPIWVSYLDDGVTLENLNVYSNILVIISLNDTGEVMERYSMNPFTDADGNVFNTADFEVINQSGGEFSVHIQPSKTTGAKLGIYQAEIITHRIDSSFENNYQPLSIESFCFAIV